MVIWGIVWGVLFSWWFLHWGTAFYIVGGVIGALIGYTLRHSVRNEFVRLQQAETAKAAIDGLSFDPKPMSSDALLSATPVAVPMPETVATEQAEAPIEAHISEPSEQEIVSIPVAATNAEHDTPRPSELSKLWLSARNWLLGGNTVARVGALLLFVGLAFLAKWAADNSMFPPEIRLAAITLAAVAIFVQGARLSVRDRNQAKADTDGSMPSYRLAYGVLLQGLGIAVLYLALFAAFKLYGLLPSSLAFALMLLVCALSSLIALLQNVQVLAFVGFAGAFATPILLSDGSGSHVMLFSYYLLINIAIAVIAWWRAWRSLNLLGFFSSFSVASAWGVLRYAPENYSSVQAFLIAFFLIYLIIGLFYALRHSQVTKHPVDATLVFGLPIVAFALQVGLVYEIAYGAAISAIVLAALYIVLAFGLRSRNTTVARWLLQSYAAIGLVLATLAAPLAMDNRLTAAVWAIEGAGVYWLSRQQGKTLGQWFAIALQLLASIVTLYGNEPTFNEVTASQYGASSVYRLPFVNALFMSYLMLAVGMLAISWWSRFDHIKAESVESDDKDRTSISALVSVVLFVIGFAWALYGVWSELLVAAALTDSILLSLFALSYVLLAAISFVAWRRYQWHSARLPVFLVLPLMLILAVMIMLINRPGVFSLVSWLIAFGLHLWMLRGIDDQRPLGYWRWVHVGTVLLVFVLLSLLLSNAIVSAELWQSDWARVIYLLIATLILMLIGRTAWWSADASTLRWPLNRFRNEYLLLTGALLGAMTLFGALIIACTSRGVTDPLPYIPLLNPVDLCVLLALAAVALWCLRVQRAEWVMPTLMWRSRSIWIVLAVVTFIAINTIWLRIAHHFFGVPWSGFALALSFVVQAGYSVLWTVLALAAMIMAHRIANRLVWQIGAVLLAITVLKLLLIDLSNSGGAERIVAFIAVGAMMVAIGYFSPLPPVRRGVAIIKD